MQENKLINLEAEQIVLGTCIMNNAYFEKIADILEAKHFAHPAHQAILEHFIKIAQEKVADSITLAEFFKNDKDVASLGGIEYLATLLSFASSIMNIRQYAFMLVELWQKRELKALLESSLENLSNNNFTKISAGLENDIAGLVIHDPKSKTLHIKEIIVEDEKADELGVSPIFVPTGFEKLDEYLGGGVYAKQLMVVGARPSVGKTSLAQNMMINSSKLGKKCLFISLEVDRKNIMLKFLSNLASVSTWKILKKRMSQHEYQAFLQSKEQLKSFEIYVNDSSSLSMPQINSIVKNQIAKQKIDLVVVDYVQIIKSFDTKNKNEALIIKENTTALKALAKQYDVAVIALAQINRKAVEGSKQEPTINDFKGSGGIEEDADVCLILHRDRSEDETSYFSRAGKFIVAKNRHGTTGQITIDFDGEFGIFREINNI